MIPLFKPHIPEGAGAAIEAVLNSGQIAGDGRHAEFEAQLAGFLGAPHVAATAEFSRTLEMALRLAGVGPGDVVLTSPLACLATTLPILQVGARPLWCDVDPATGGIEAEEIRRRRTAATKAVLVYHWVGVPADIDAILRVAGELGLPTIEDAGESLGASYGGRRVGSHGFDYSVFSFSPARHVTTGEGAAIACRDQAQDARARLVRRHGIPDRGFRDARGEISPACDIVVAGTHNYMNRMAGALGLLQLQRLPQLVERHHANGLFFDEQLAAVDGIDLLSRDNGRTPSHWVYCFLCERRDDLLRVLREAGVYTSMVHLRNDVYSCFEADRPALPRVDEFTRRQLCIPCGWWVSDEERARIVDTIRKGW